MYKSIIEDLVIEVRDPSYTKNFLLRDLFYVANKFTITSAFRTLIPKYTSGLYAFVEEGNFEKYDTDFIIRYLGRAEDIQKRLLQHEKQINNVLEKIRAGVTEKNKYFQFAEKILTDPKKYAVYIWRWREPRPIHKLVFNDEKIGLKDAEGIFGGLIGEVFGNDCYNKEFVSTSIRALEEPNINFLRKKTELIAEAKLYEKKPILDLWYKWLSKNITQKDIPLFSYKEKTMKVITQIKNNGSKRILRHPEMEDLLAEEIQKIHNSYTKSKEKFEFDGLIYLVYTYKKHIEMETNGNLNLQDLSEEDIIPLYIGKTETIGVNGKYSVNIKNVHKKLNKGKFARWGDARAYHIGDLSDAIFDREKAENFRKYSKWAECFFEMKDHQDNDSAILNFPIYFWCKAWHKDDKGLILDLPCSTCFLERQLISLSNLLVPELLLNKK
ncbi:MAG: hypothetical protein ACTSXD_01500 [Candidatus Heimdallarchaeaceae archaeon]